MFRLVIYTSSADIYANTVIEHIDRYNMIHERLYRKDLIKVDDKTIKDLTKLNKDMSRVLLVDSKTDGCLQSDNLIRIKPFFGNQDDAELKQLYMLFKDKISEIEHNIDLRSLAKEFNIE